VSLAGGGPVGQNFAHVAYTSGSGSYSIFPTVRPVRPPTVGATYTAGGWVRSDVPGKNVCLRFREWSGSSQVGAAQTCRTATTSWVPFNTVSYTSVGGDSLEIVPYQSNPVAGDAFDVDGLRVLGP
jgi:hypothetical protein